ncbi:MAG: protein-export chaperone SecB [Gammaproteobacteria bacterium]|nr:MAG: protein-export chaperone SecB [Gammaproteobacteria bacterium]
MAEENTRDTSQDNPQNQPMFNIEKVYLKDMSFESPQSPSVFTQEAQPHGDVNLEVRHTVLDEEKGFYEVVLFMRVQAKEKEHTWFLVELEQAGVFLVRNVPDGELPKLLEIACPNILLPYAREAISDLTIKGGFPPMMIQPVNFEAMYFQKLQAAKSGGAENSDDSAEKVKH